MTLRILFAAAETNIRRVLASDVTRNTGLLMALRVLQTITSLINIYLLIRYFAPEDFGVYRYTLSFVAVVAIVALPGLQVAVKQSVARGAYGIFRKVIWYPPLACLVASLVLIIAALWHLSRGDEALILDCFIVAAICMPFLHGLTLWRGVIAGEERFFKISLMEALPALASTSLLALGIYLEFLTLVWATAITLGIPLLFNIYLTIEQWRYLANKGDTIEAGSIKYGLRINIYVALNVLANHLDKLIIFIALDAVSLVIYAIADRIYWLSKSVCVDLAAVLAPKFAKREVFDHILDRNLKIIGACIGAGLLVGAIFVVPPLLPLLVGERYNDAIIYTQALMASCAIGNFATLRIRYVQSKLDLKSFRDYTVAVSSMQIVAALVLIPTFGLWGAVGASLISHIVTVVVTDFIIRKRYLVHVPTETG